ncbi:MAG: GNAT family N-acetyltransferase [Victivallaceae bacterium]|nr:GNAT family N-acetyltransferase [Victivallaceae bacterium]
MDGITIRNENREERRTIENLVREAFWDVFKPGCDEHYLLHLLREVPAFLPALDFVAEIDGKPAGFCCSSRGKIAVAPGENLEVVVLGPIGVLPEVQGKGIGSALVERTLTDAAEAGFGAVVLYGNPAFYGRFGFEPGEKFGVSDVSGDFCPALLVNELKPGFVKPGKFSEDPVFMIAEADAAGFDTGFAPKTKHAKAGQLFLGGGVIRPTGEEDFETIFEIVNDAASAYKGVIPADRWHEPYMPREELRSEIADGVKFYGYYVNGLLVGVMGIQDRNEVWLIRHAYVRTACRNCGIGGKLLAELHAGAGKPMLIGTWADAVWAVRFYEKNGFSIVPDREVKSTLLRRFWRIPERQVETSVVLWDREV